MLAFAEVLIQPRQGIRLVPQGGQRTLRADLAETPEAQVSADGRNGHNRSKRCRSMTGGANANARAKQLHDATGYHGDTAAQNSRERWAPAHSRSPLQTGANYLETVLMQGVARGLLGHHIRVTKGELHSVDGETTLSGRDYHRAAVRNLAFEQQLCQWVLQSALDHPL